MPRSDAVASPGCAPVRAIAFDSLGLVKVVETSGENGNAQVVARWGEPNSQKSVLCASMSSDDDVQVLAVARRNNSVDILDPTCGAPYTQVNVSSNSPENAQIIGIHLLRAEASCTRSLVACTSNGIVSVHHVSGGSTEQNVDDPVTLTWPICKAGNIICMKVDLAEKYAAFGGDGAEPAIWEINTQTKIWEAKAPRRDSMGLMSRPFVTSSTFLGNDHRKLIVGTGHHQIRLYDISAQRRPTISFDYLESPIKAVEADSDGYSIFVGTGNGDLASLDMRTGKLLGGFKGKCSGSVRSIAKHPALPILATCGLDRYLRFFHSTTRQLLTRIFLKQQLVAVVFDKKYSDRSAGNNDVNEDSRPMEVISNGHRDEECHVTSSTDQSQRKRKPKKAGALDGSLKRSKKKEEASSDGNGNHSSEGESEKENKPRKKKAKKKSRTKHGEEEDELLGIENGKETDEIVQVESEEADEAAVIRDRKKTKKKEKRKKKQEKDIC